MSVEIPRSIFRAYDIRGIVDDTFNADVMYQIALAIGELAQEQNIETLVIGRDGRLSGPELFAALRLGLLKSGINVIDVGMVPSPVLYFATYHLETLSGISLTASHNPPEYNGLKIVLNGRRLAEEDIHALYQRTVKVSEPKGSMGQLREHAILPDYLARVSQNIHFKKPLKVVLDCANGVASTTAPDTLKQLGCEVLPLFCEVDGHFPNHEPDPIVPENLEALIEKTLSSNADLGLALDGDGDRVVAIDNMGNIIWPDRMMILFSREILSRNPGAQVIYDVKCTQHLEKAIEDAGGKPIMCKTGHSFLSHKMRETGALLAGELSGHFFFKEDWYGFDDGLYAALRFLQIIAADDKPVDHIFKDIPTTITTPEIKIDVPEQDKFTIVEALVQSCTNLIEGKINAIDGLRIDFKDGWGLVRASNTTPCLTLRFEADNEQAMARIQDIFREKLLEVDEEMALPF